MTTPARLVFVGAAVLDVTTWIDHPPPRGADLVAGDGALTPGGGFNVMAAAARQGIEVVFAGHHGTGPAGDLVRAALAAEGIGTLRVADADADTGFVVSMVEPDGERTFVTSPAALRSPDLAALAEVPVAAGDIVYVSGYGLASAQGADLAVWVAALDPSVTLVVDPGPLAPDVPAARLSRVLVRADWWSCNLPEATGLTRLDDPVEAALELSAGRRHGGVVVRTGADGCIVVRPGDPTRPVRIPAPTVDAVDTTGAGDTHVGVFVAGLATGLGPLAAAQRANVAAALSVTRRGPATAPGRAELDRVVAGQAGLRFRPATGADVGEVVALVESAYRGDASRAGWTTEADLLGGVRTDAGEVAGIVADPGSLLLLADDAADALVACCHLRRDEGRAYFGMFAVRPGTQGAGIGRAVVAEAERHARDRWHCGEMWMTVIRQRTELIAWYERLGFRVTGETRPFPYGDERFGVPKRDDLEFAVLRKALD